MTNFNNKRFHRKGNCNYDRQDRPTSQWICQMVVSTGMIICFLWTKKCPVCARKRSFKCNRFVVLMYIRSKQLLSECRDGYHSAHRYSNQRSALPRCPILYTRRLDRLLTCHLRHLFLTESILLHHDRLTAELVDLRRLEFARRHLVLKENGKFTISSLAGLRKAEICPEEAEQAGAGPEKTCLRSPVPRAL